MAAFHESRAPELLRHCARPAFALGCLREIDAGHLVHESIKPGPGGGVRVMLTPLELIERLVALIAPPRRHRHRSYDAEAPNAPLRAQVTALAGMPNSTPRAAATDPPEAIATTAPPINTPRPSSMGTEEARGEEEALLRRAARYTLGAGARPDPCGLSARLPMLRWRDANHCLHHRRLRRAQHPDPDRRADIAAAPDSLRCAAALGDAGRHHRRGRPTGSIGVGVRVRPAHHLVGAAWKQDELPSPVVGRGPTRARGHPPGRSGSADGPWR